MTTTTTSPTSVPALRTAPSPASMRANSGFIIGPVADSVLIIGAPLVALVIAGPLFALPSATFDISIRTKPYDLRQVAILTFINAHLFLVYFRSHLNQNIFRMYPVRFIVAPLVLFALGAFSPAALGIMGVVAVWWDVYHSGMQTFGFGRIYDAKQKNDAVLGRRLDYWMNLLVYLGPVLAGAHFIDHLKSSQDSLQFLATDGNVLKELLLQRAPDFLVRYQAYLTVAILAVGVPYSLYYVFAYYRLQQRGYRVSWQKVWLLIITAAVSIYCWGFHSFIDAFWVMNFFHALQYFAIVTFAEHRNLAQLLRTSWFSHGGLLATFWVVSFCLLYGFWSGFFISGATTSSLVVTTSIMHFWYDGFIWSVKKKQV